MLLSLLKTQVILESSKELEFISLNLGSGIFNLSEANSIDFFYYYIYHF